MSKKYKPCVNDVVVRVAAEDFRQFDQRQVPSVLCPIFACICCWPLGIGAVASYLDAKDALENADLPWLESSVRHTKIFSTAAIVSGSLILCLITAVVAWCMYHSTF